jgi:probable O-glycosylation ligase (exosortase A-associated)
MKQFILLVALTGFGVGASFAWTPYAGVALYYFYAILRPQYLWKWQLANYPSVGWSFYLAGAAVFGYLLWSAGFLSFGRKETSLMRFRPAFTWPHRLMMLFAFWICMSYVFSNDHEQSEAWFAEYLKIFAMYFLASRVVRTPGQVWGLYLLVTVALGYIAVEANWIYLETGNLVLYKAGFAGLDNNGAALMLALGVPLCYFAWEATAGHYRWAYLALIPVIIHAVLGTYSRGAMLSMIAAAPFYMVFARRRRFLLLVYLGVAVSLPFLAGKEIQDRFFSVQEREVDESWQSRQLSWKIAREIAWDYPVFGAGIRCSNAEMKQRGADMEGRTIHSQYLQVAADSGLFALATYLVMAAATFWAMGGAYLQLRRRTDPDAVRAVAVLGGVWCSLLTYLVGAVALSLEVFEASYLLFLLGAQVGALLHATDTLAAGGPSAAAVARPWAAGPGGLLGRYRPVGS